VARGSWTREQMARANWRSTSRSACQTSQRNARCVIQAEDVEDKSAIVASRETRN